MKNLLSGQRTVLAVVLLTVSLVALSCAQPAPPAPTATAQPAPAATAKPAPPAPSPTQPPKPSQPTPAAAKPVEMVTVRTGHMGIPSDVPTYIAIEKGYFKAEGINIEITPFDTAAKMIAPMAAGQLDVGRGSPSAGLFNAIARDVPIKIVADISRVTPGNKFLGLVVRKDLFDSGALKDYSDMKGRNVAYNAKGTGNEVDIEKALKKGNLSFSDANVMEMPFANMNTALANKAVDVAYTIEPNITIGQQRGILGFWKPAYDFTPDHQLALLMYAPGFVKDRPEVAKRYMVAYLKGIRDYYDAFFKNKNKSEIISVLTKNTATKDPTMFEKMIPHGVDTNGYVNAKSVMEDQEWFLAKGQIQKKIDEKALIDNQFVDFAVQQLGKYQ